MRKTVVGIFQDDSDVKTAIDKFKSEGFKSEDFSIFIKNERKARQLNNDTSANVSSSSATDRGLLNALMGTGLRRDDAKYYEKQINAEAILLAVPTRENQLELVMTIFDDSNTSDVKIVSHAASETVIVSDHAYDDNALYLQIGAKGGKVGTLSKETIKGAKAL